MDNKYSVIVVGGGHAGVEASMASANMGEKTLLITLNFNKVANMPCNPSIGGSAKGIVVREIDALGGMMGIFADHNPLQIKMLNTGKGPGVQCLRSQADKIDYPRNVQKILKNTKNLDIVEAMVKELIVEGKKITGVILEDGVKIHANAVILTTGTYMESTVLIGHNVKEEGPEGDRPSIGLSPFLAKLGFDLFRLKTGTPQRIKKESIDFSKTQVEEGMEGYLNFSFLNERHITKEEQVVCHLIYTQPKTHEIINQHLQDSAMYGGFVHGTGPRYCPSIEDKVVRFNDKPRHQLFLEPESRFSDSIYLQGFSTSMPEHVQDLMVRSLPGLENAIILKYAYAIEYDALDPLQFKHTLETKLYENLYCAGQIIGTSGYEEAAGLGLMAGINAVLKIRGKQPLVLKRNEAYIGVMIDDLVTKGTSEPYRLLSSRAEYRLLLRHDNADLRLTELGRKVGLVDDFRYNIFTMKNDLLKESINIIKTTNVSTKSEVASMLSNLGYENFNGGSLSDILKRPDVTLDSLISLVPNLKALNIGPTARQQIEVIIKYEGYIEKQRIEAEKFATMETMKINAPIDYMVMDGLRIEARQKLNKIQPVTIGQAKRISGVNPSDIAILMMYLKKNSYGN